MKPLIDNNYKLEKFQGKGGWTFAQIPEVKSDKSKPFGWVKVRGTIDGCEFRKVHLMPMGNGRLFFPVNAELRKKIKKKEGDRVHIVLFPDDEPLKVPKEIMLCLKDDPAALKFFSSLSESEQLYYIKWIYSARKEETKVSRMAKAIDRLARRLKMYDKDSPSDMVD